MIEKKIETIFQIYKFDELDTKQQELIQKAKEQVTNAYAPYSNFMVGAAVLLENGEIFAGSNQENSAYPSGLCAERVALFYANSNRPKASVKSIAIAAFHDNEFLKEPTPPCGSCRQVLLECENRFDSSIQTILYGTEYVIIINSIKQLLPLEFGKNNLNKCK